MKLALVFASLYASVFAGVIRQPDAQGILAKSTASKTITAKSCTSRQPNTTDIQNTSYVDHVKAITVPSGVTFRHVLIEPKDSKPWLLFLHGFPSSSYDWRRQIDHFGALGYGIIAPDLLGAGGTDRPTNLESFRLKSMVTDLVDLLDCNDIKRVVAISHDFGSLLLSRVNIYAPQRLIASAYLDIGYTPPTFGMDTTGLKRINDLTKLLVGYPIFGYWNFLIQPDTPAILDKHASSFARMLYSSDMSLWKRLFSNPDMFREFVLADGTTGTSTWMTEQEYQTHERITAMGGGYGSAINWYKSQLAGVNKQDDDRVSYSQMRITHPVLVITAAVDPVGLPSLATGPTRVFASNFTQKSVEAGHFLMLQKTAEVNDYLQSFIKSL